MKRLFILFIAAFVLFASELYGQDTATKYIIVDTIILGDGVSANLIENFSFLRRVNDKFVSIENNFWDSKYFPSLNCKVKFIMGDDLAVGILIDDNGGEIELHHLEKAGDTIHISTYCIYNNCLFDSITTSVHYYHHINDTLLIPYKEKFQTILPDNSCRDTLKKIVLNINRRAYSIPIQFSKTTHIQVYDGFPKRKDRRRSIANWNTGNRKNKKKSKFNSFSGGTDSYRYSYFGRLDLH